jgi:hypothetical protein
MNSNDLLGTGMTKLIYSGSMPDGCEFQMEIIEDPAQFMKRASNAGGLFDYEALKADNDHVGIHVLALGDSERYGFNRNADGFPKAANQRFLRDVKRDLNDSVFSDALNTLNTALDGGGPRR